MTDTNDNENMQPSRPKKVPAAKAVPTKLEPQVTPPETTTNKYARRPKIGQGPKIGTPVNRVTSVGLGGLRVETAMGVQTPDNNQETK